MQDLAKRRLTTTTSARGAAANLRTEPEQHHVTDTVQPDEDNSTQTSGTERHFPRPHRSKVSSIHDKSSQEQLRDSGFQREPSQHDAEIKSPQLSSENSDLANLLSLQLVTHSPRRGFTSPACLPPLMMGSEQADTELPRTSAVPNGDHHCWICRDEVGGDVVELSGIGGRLLCSRCRALSSRVDSARQRK